jgi:hypothetical protein
MTYIRNHQMRAKRWTLLLGCWLLSSFVWLNGGLRAQCSGALQVPVLGSTSGQPLSATATPTQAAYCATLGEAVATVLGGSTPYQYTWVGNASTSNTAANLAAGMQTVNVRDDKGCTTSANTNIVINSLIVSAAGADITQVGGTYTMVANAAIPGTGVWTLRSGTATIVTPNSPTTRVTGIAIGGTATLRWTITNGTCESFDEIVLTRSGSYVYLNAKTILEGPYNSTTGLMNDALRSQGGLPATEPYSALGYTHVGGGNEAMTNNAFSVTGNDAIVDWVMVELRDKNNAQAVIATRSGLLQRDGDIVDVDGTSPLAFGALADDYYVVVRHRNHVRFRSNVAITFPSSGAVTLNFANGSTPTFGSAALKTIGAGVKAMYAGDPSGNGLVGASDINNYWRVTAGQMLPYDLGDFNMDGNTFASDFNNYWRANSGIFIPIF